MGYAKRRSHAIIIDHLTPPMMQAETYGDLVELAQLADEYYQVEQLDPSKLPLFHRQIWELLKHAKLDSDLKLIINRDSTSHTHEFAKKNNRTVAETLGHKRCTALAVQIEQNYPHALDEKLGDFLFGLKQTGYPFYQLF